jgi:rhamnogalacturonyl hydrolase YesR
MRHMFFCIVLICLSRTLTLAQEKTLTKADILEAIRQTADCASNILVDKDGKARGDYSLTDGTWSDYEPAWHTGQTINALVAAYKVTHDERYLAAAKKSGDWWIGLEIKDHPTLKGMVRAIHGDGINNIVFATISDGTPGLFHLYDVTKDPKYAAVPTSAGEWMLNNMYVPDKRVFYDNVDPTTGDVMRDRSPFWPDKKEQSLFDVARPNNEGSLFRDIYLYTKEEKYKNIFVELCESLVEKQDKYGLWMDFTPNDKQFGFFHPRFNLWYAESLIDGFEMTGNKKYLEAALRTLRTYQKAMKEDGTFYYINLVDGKYIEGSVTGSATAFCGILWTRVIKLGAGEEFSKSLDIALRWILRNRFSPSHPDSNLRGAVIDTRGKRKNGTYSLVQRDVGTSFGLRFLSDYYNYKYGNK